jgi:hypothetical protein
MVEEFPHPPTHEAPMSRTRAGPPEPFTATIRVQGQDFPFQIHHRPLPLGPAGTVQYYWMDSSQFRIARAKRGLDPANFRNCVGHWWRTIQSGGLARDPGQIRHLILATSYALVSRDNALQNVYRDAHLAKDATKPQEQSLPEPIRHRIHAVVAGRDVDRLREELDLQLGGAKVQVGEMPLIRQTLEGILQHGIDSFGRDGEGGLEEFLGRLDAWLAKVRKKGGGGWRRSLLDLLSYQCKVSFYRCYANTWVDLIPWLRENRDLDIASERFLRVWHMQNQPLERPDGRVIPDVFGGQVLSLHPLSGFLMKDPALRAIAGRFFLSGSYEQVMSRGRVGECAEYWDVVGAILSAAALYRQALDHQAERRGVHPRTTHDPNLVLVADETRSGAGLLDEFARDLALLCSHCRAQLHFRSYEPADPDDDGFDADFACPVCGHQVRRRIPRHDLEAWLLSQS